MTNTTQVTAEMFLFCLQEILKTPGINRVNLIQSIAPTIPLSDAQGHAIPGKIELVITEFKPDDLEIKPPKPIEFRPGLVGIHFEVYGKLPRPVLPAPGFLAVALQKVRGGLPLPIVLVWTEINLDTFEFHALSQGPPMVQQTTPALN